jgi:TonB family protein
VAASTMTGRRSRMGKRLERLWSTHRPSSAANPITRLLFVAAFCPMLYVAAGTRFDQAEGRVMSVANQEQADKLEADVLRDPQNLSERNALIAFYFNQREGALWTKHLLWLIENHPESSMAATITPTFAEDHAQLNAAWEQALVKHSDSAEVLFHAGLFFDQQDPLRALSLFNRARNMVDPHSTACQRYSHMAAWIYARALMTTSAQVGTLRAEVESSSDPALLSEVGTVMNKFGHIEPGLSLIQRAIDLAPTNPEWKEALESAKAEPIRIRNSREMITGEPTGPMQISPSVANANLLNKAEAEYPLTARQQGVEGDVEFSVEIGRDGHIQALQLVRGHPLLVNAAKDAVLQWTYRPTLVNGKEVSVTTSVIVSFALQP